jgi:hypothetical protein
MPCEHEQLEPRQLLAVGPALTLINADTDQSITGFELYHGVTIDLAATGRHLSIRADVSGPAASVRFNYDGDANYRIENSAPYAIAGDANDGANYLPWLPELGLHTLIVTPYVNADGTGARGTSRVIQFNVTDSSALAQSVRINAGGGALIDSAGTRFASDQGFTGGATSSTGGAIASTADEALYQSYRFGASFDFAHDLPNGAYTLTLYFIEPDFKHPGHRTFDVLAEDCVILNEFDIVAQAGKRVAVSKTFTVGVEDGRLDLAFRGTVRKAIVSAIEVVPAPRSISNPAPVRVNAGGGFYVDSLNRFFDPDSGFSGGVTCSAAVDVLNTTDDVLFNTYRSGSAFSFSRLVANGNYDLWLEFDDPTATLAGQRTFDVFAEGRQVLDDYDIVKTVGANTAVATSFHVSVSDGSLDVDFKAVAGDAIVSAIVLVPTDVPEAVKPYTDTSLGAAASAMLRFGHGIFFYGNEHRGNLPPDVISLFDWRDLPLHSNFVDPRSPTALPRGELSKLEQRPWILSLNDFIYVGAGLRFRDLKTETILAYENPQRVSGQVFAFFGDGSVKLIDPPAAASPAQTQLPAIPLTAAADPGVLASKRNLQLFYQSLHAYSNNNRGRFPTNWGLLFDHYLKDATNFLNPRGQTPPPPIGATADETRTWIDASTDYLYLAANKPNGLAPDAVMVFENPADMSDGINLLYADARVDFREMQWAVEILARAGAL